jgi:transcriptional regulator with XRE-family HTH domain
MGRHKRMSKQRPGSEVLGRRLRALRHDRGLRLVDLGAATGLSHAFLSQVECGAAYPSLSTLWIIADALGVQPGLLLQEHTTHEPFIVRGGEGRVVLETDDEPGAVLRARSELHHLKATIAEGQLDATGFDSHSGEEFVYVVDGVLEITVGDARHRLERGDSIVFDGSIPHGYETLGDADARVLFVFTMQGLEDDPVDGQSAWFRRVLRAGRTSNGVHPAAARAATPDESLTTG